MRRQARNWDSGENPALAEITPRTGTRQLPLPNHSHTYHDVLVAARIFFQGQCTSKSPKTQTLTDRTSNLWECDSAAGVGTGPEARQGNLLGQGVRKAPKTIRRGLERWPWERGVSCRRFWLVDLFYFREAERTCFVVGRSRVCDRSTWPPAADTIEGESPERHTPTLEVKLCHLPI